MAQVRSRMRWDDNVRQDATSLGVRDLQGSARDRGQWKDVVEAAVGLQTLECQRNGMEWKILLLKIFDRF